MTITSATTTTTSSTILNTNDSVPTYPNKNDSAIEECVRCHFCSGKSLYLSLFSHTTNKSCSFHNKIVCLLCIPFSKECYECGDPLNVTEIKIISLFDALDLAGCAASKKPLDRLSYLDLAGPVAIRDTTFFSEDEGADSEYSY